MNEALGPRIGDARRFEREADLPAVARACRCDRVPLRCRAADGEWRKRRVVDELRITSASRSGKTSSSSTASSTRAGSLARGRRLRVRTQSFERGLSRMKLKLFRYKGPANGTLTVQDVGLAVAARCGLLAPKYGASARRRSARRRRCEWTASSSSCTTMRHRRPRARSREGRKVLEYIACARLWRPVTVTTVDNEGRSADLAVSLSTLS